MPYSHDQPDNARRVRRLGVARVIRRRKYTAEIAARKITLLLENSACASARPESGHSCAAKTD